MVDDFLPDEFVLDEVPEPEHGPTVIFAGPSDAPPVLPASPAAAPRTARSRRPYVLLVLAVCAAAALAASKGMEPASRERIEKAGPLASRDEPSGNSTAASGPPSAAPPTASASPDASGPAEDAKWAAQTALEKGRTMRAIEEGERAVALDPTDAEAWLILGAAHDQKGAYAQARRCFEKCVRMATRGPRGECAALLR